MREMRDRILAEGWRKAEGQLNFSTKRVELAGRADGRFSLFFRRTDAVPDSLF